MITERSLQVLKNTHILLFFFNNKRNQHFILELTVANKCNTNSSSANMINRNLKTAKCFGEIQTLTSCSTDIFFRTRQEP